MAIFPSRRKKSGEYSPGFIPPGKYAGYCICNVSCVYPDSGAAERKIISALEKTFLGKYSPPLRQPWSRWGRERMRCPGITYI
jgi:hypothetical protein